MWNCCYGVYPHGMAKQPSLPVWCTFAVARVHRAAPEPFAAPVCMRAQVDAEVQKWGLPLPTPEAEAVCELFPFPVPLLQAGQSVF